MNSLLHSNVQQALTDTLKEEIQLFRKSDKAKLLNEETFDPQSSFFCFLGQTDQQVEEPEGVDVYRDTIGRVPSGFGLAHLDNMTPLEIWSAYYWNHNKALVLEVFKYIKGEVHSCPEIEFAEAKTA